MGLDDTTKEMFLEAYFPGAGPQKVLENMEFTVDVSAPGSWNRPPNGS
jgi:hypothetical protein